MSITVQTIPSSTNVTVHDSNNLTVAVQQSAQVNLEVTAVPTQTIQINRGVSGPPGPPGPNTIGGYPISIVAAQNYDVLMFQTNEWTNVPQTEIADGGNF